MRKEEYLNAVCQNIKYRGIRDEIKNELSEHIDEAAQFYEDEGVNAESAVVRAVTDMGKPEDVASKLNKQYRMPFNSRYGLMLWSAVATAVVYFVIYPLIAIINTELSIVRHEGLTTFAVLLLFLMVNYCILRRGHFRVNKYDVRDIAVGFILSAVFSCAVLYLLSMIGRYSYYLYYPKIKIMTLDSINIYGGEVRGPFYEMLSILSYLTLYLISCPLKRKTWDASFGVYANTPYAPVIFIDNDGKAHGKCR